MGKGGQIQREKDRQLVKTIINKINQAWQNGTPEDLARFLHPDIVMVFPGFNERSSGFTAFIAGFQDFCIN